jgi:hypothetical protein
MVSVMLETIYTTGDSMETAIAALLAEQPSGEPE